MKTRYFDNNEKYFTWYNKKKDIIKINNIKINKNNLVIKYTLKDLLCQK